MDGPFFKDVCPAKGGSAWKRQSFLNMPFPRLGLSDTWAPLNEEPDEKGSHRLLPDLASQEAELEAAAKAVEKFD